MAKKQNKKTTSKKPAAKKKQKESKGKSTQEKDVASPPIVVIDAVVRTEGDDENKELSPDILEEIVAEAPAGIDDEMDLKDDDDMDDEGEDWE